MALSLTKENYLLHKIHSLTGIVPVGYYVFQHLALNTFSLAGPAYFNGVIHFFDSMPRHFLLAIEVLGIWLPLLFHAFYGLVIASHAQGNYVFGKYKWSQNRMFTLQRYTGVFLVFFLCIHVATTTGVKYLNDDAHLVQYAAMQERFTSMGGLWLVLYALGVLTASYHLAYGIWNFCIRWGITISEAAQARMQKVSFWAFVVITLMGWGALGGFLIHEPTDTASTHVVVPSTNAPDSL